MDNSPPGPRENAPRTELHVVFVEDCVDDVELAVRCLERDGFAVTWKRVDTAEGLQEAIRRKQPQLVVSDYAMPRLDGLEALDLVRRIDSALPFILLSGTVRKQVVEAVLANRANRILFKDHMRRLPGLVREVMRAEQCAAGR